MSKEESTNKRTKAIYLRQNMGNAKTFKPNPDCDGRFLAHCDSKADIVRDEFYGTMCSKCMTEAKRIHMQAMAAPAKPLKAWADIATGSSGFSREKFGSGGETKTLTRKVRSDKKCQD